MQSPEHKEGNVISQYGNYPYAMCYKNSVIETRKERLFDQCERSVRLIQRGMMNIALCRDADPVTNGSFKNLFDPSGDPGQEGKGGEVCVLQNDGTGCNDGAATNQGTIHDDSSHPDHTVVFYRAAVHYAAMAHGYLVADMERMASAHVQNRKVLDVCSFTDGNGSNVPPDYAVEPDG